MYDKFLSVFEQVVPLSTEEKDAIQSAVNPITFSRKQKLLDSGAVSQEMFFVNKGLLRLYGYKEGEEKTLFFFTEGMLAGNIRSYLPEKPSELVIESMEEGNGLVITKNALEDLFAFSPKISLVGLALTQVRMTQLLDFFSSFVLDSPEERYLKFIESHPNLVQRVPQHIIASFLGVTPVSLSRIRKRVTGR